MVTAKSHKALILGVKSSVVLGVLDRAAFSREGGRKCQISRFIITNIYYLLNHIRDLLEELRKHLIISTTKLKKISNGKFEVTELT